MQLVKNKKIILFLKEYNRKDIILNLMKKNSIDIFNKNNETPLNWACQLGLFDLSMLLIKKTKDINLKDNFGLTALNKAVNSEIKNRDLIMFLIKNGSNINSIDINGDCILINGLINSKNDFNLLILMDYKLNLNNLKKNIVLLSIQRGSIAILEKILSISEKNNIKKNECIELAIKKSKIIKI